MNANIAEKQERALYKNLETLEDKKLISYDNKKLTLTKKGISLFGKLDKDMMPYITLYCKLKASSPTRYVKKVQTVLCDS